MDDQTQEVYFEERLVRTLAGCRFVIPNYQRGYKWEPLQVQELLQDIGEHNDSIKYCLQPLVLKKQEDGVAYDLIDGQQRCTTIFLILQHLEVISQHPEGGSFFEMEYRTREESRDFLGALSRFSDGVMSAAWADFVSLSPQYDFVDNYYLFNACKEIRSFFSGKSADEIARFRNSLLDQTFFIWYEIRSSERAEQVFQNFNSGKIGLTAAELIKSLILIDIQQEANVQVRELRVAEFALQWEQIEAGLEDREFWYFLQPDKKAYPTRIDFLFELQLAAQAPAADKNDSLRTYHYYSHQTGEGQLQRSWLDVVAMYKKLRSWCSDLRLYHRIGFLVASKISRLDVIITMSNKAGGQRAFYAALEEAIKEKFRSQNRGDSGENVFVYAPDRMRYGANNKELEQVLLLFNVLSYESLLSGARFPFWDYNEIGWSLEHIHPQNPRSLNTPQELREWLNEQKILASGESDSAELLTKIHEIEDSLIPGLTKIPRDLESRLQELSEQLANEFNLHGLGNLALLDGNTNGRVGNRPFQEKREKILEIVEEEDAYYIPYATRNVFSKYYTKGEGSITMHSWNTEDADDYLAAIQKMLANYLPPVTHVHN